MPELVFLADESSEEEEVKEVTEEEHEVGVACSWMEVGGFTVLAEEEAQGLLWQVYPFTWYGLVFLPILLLCYG